MIRRLRRSRELRRGQALFSVFRRITIAKLSRYFMRMIRRAVLGVLRVLVAFPFNQAAEYAEMLMVLNGWLSSASTLKRMAKKCVVKDGKPSAQHSFFTTHFFASQSSALFYAGGDRRGHCNSAGVTNNTIKVLSPDPCLLSNGSGCRRCFSFNAEPKQTAKLR